MLKKIKAILLSAVILLMPVISNAQPAKNEIGVQYGQFTLLEGAYVLGGVFGAMFSLGHFNFDNMHALGNLGVSYTRNVNNWFGYGGIACAECITSDTYTTDGDGNKTYNGKFNMGAVALMPTATFSWFRNPHFGMYSKIGAGVGVSLSSEPSVFPAAQVSPVCMEFGGETLKGTFEAGVGMLGIVSLGIKKQF